MITYFNLSQQATISVSVDGEKTLDDYLSVIRRIQDFLTLAMTQPTFPTEVKGTTDANKQVIEGKDFYPPIEIYYQLPWTITEMRDAHFFEMLFTLPTVQDKLEACVRNWFNKADTLKPVYDLYFSTLYSPQTYLEFKFLSLAQALETYHRRIYGGKYQSDQKYLGGLYKRFVESIPPDLDDGFKHSLIKGKFRYANEYSLRKRLQELGMRYFPIIPFGFLQDKNEINIFADKVHNTRNYLTHYTQELESKTARGKELFDLTDKMRALLDVIFLEEIGFSQDSIREMITRTRRYLTVIKH